MSGTGLDVLTTDISSAGEGIRKIRMLLWSIEDFPKLTQDESIVKLVPKHVVIGTMVSNPRAASFLVKWLKQSEK